MAKDFNALAKSVVENIGGEENVVNLTHCITRLRFKLKDEALANDEAVAKVPGVMKVLHSGGQYQVVIGNDVADAYEAVLKNFNIKTTGEAAPAAAAAPQSKRKVGEVLVDMISGIFMPFMGAFGAAGLLKGFLVLFTTLGWLDKSGSTYSILYAVADGIFYCLPVFLAYTAGQKFGAKPFVTMALAAGMIHSNIVALNGAEGVSFMGIPVDVISYTSSVLPIVVTAFAQAWFEKLQKKFVPKMLRSMIIPLLDFVVLFPLALIVIGPVTDYAGKLIAAGIKAGLDFAPAVAGFLMAALWPIMIIFGLHWGFVPIALNNHAVLGYDYILPLTVGCNFGIAAACLAVFLKTRNNELKQTAGPAVVSALVGGVTEPAVYGVLLKYKKPMIIVALVNGIGGAICASFHVIREVMVSVNVLTLPVIYTVYGVWGIVSIVVSFVGAFVLTWLFGFKDSMITE